MKASLVLLGLLLLTARPLYAEETALSLEEALTVALAHNPDVQFEQFERWKHAYRKEGARGLYDPVIELDSQYELDKTQQASTVLGSRQTTTIWNASVTKKFVTGTTVKGFANNERITSNSLFRSLDPAFATGWGVELHQPLGRNMGGLLDRLTVLLTDLNVDQEALQSLDRIEGAVARVAHQYWELAAHQHQVRIRKEALERAEDLHQANLKKFELGLIEEPEQLASEAQVVRRSEALDAAQVALQSEQRALSVLLDAPISTTPIVTDTLAKVGEAPAVEESIQSAYAYRRDYRQALQAVKIKHLNIRMKQNERWPLLDLTASFRANGLEEKYRASVEEAFEGNQPTYFVGMKAKWTFGETAARSAFEQAKLEKAQALVQLKQVEQNLLQQVHDASEKLQLWQESAKSRMRIEDLYARRLNLQQRRYSLGRSDVQTLIDYQQELLDAQEAVVEARKVMQQSWIDLKRSENTLLETIGFVEAQQPQ